MVCRWFLIKCVWSLLWFLGHQTKGKHIISDAWLYQEGLIGSLGFTHTVHYALLLISVSMLNYIPCACARVKLISLSICYSLSFNKW